MRKKGKIKLVLIYVVCLAVCLFLSIIWHEAIGHGLGCVLMGGRITGLDILGFRFLPDFGWSGIPGSVCGEGLSPMANDVVVIAGPLSTWCVSVLALALLWVRRRTGIIKVILVCLSLWWFDIFSETLTAWGIPRGIWFHKGAFVVYSRPPVHYEAAVQLGIPGPLFHIFSIGTSVCLLVGLTICLIRDNKRRQIKD